MSTDPGSIRGGKTRDENFAEPLLDDGALDHLIGQGQSDFCAPEVQASGDRFDPNAFALPPSAPSIDLSALFRSDALSALPPPNAQRYTLGQVTLDDAMAALEVHRTMHPAVDDDVLLARAAELRMSLDAAARGAPVDLVRTVADALQFSAGTAAYVALNALSFPEPSRLHPGALAPAGTAGLVETARQDLVTAILSRDEAARQRSAANIAILEDYAAHLQAKEQLAAALRESLPLPVKTGLVPFNLDFPECAPKAGVDPLHDMTETPCAAIPEHPFYRAFENLRRTNPARAQELSTGYDVLFSRTADQDLNPGSEEADPFGRLQQRIAGERALLAKADFLGFQKAIAEEQFAASGADRMQRNREAIFAHAADLARYDNTLEAIAAEEAGAVPTDELVRDVLAGFTAETAKLAEDATTLVYDEVMAGEGADRAYAHLAGGTTSEGGSGHVGSVREDSIEAHNAEDFVGSYEDEDAPLPPGAITVDGEARLLQGRIGALKAQFEELVHADLPRTEKLARMTELVSQLKEEKIALLRMLLAKEMSGLEEGAYAPASDVAQAADRISHADASTSGEELRDDIQALVGATERASLAQAIEHGIADIEKVKADVGNGILGIIDDHMSTTGYDDLLAQLTKARELLQAGKQDEARAIFITVFGNAKYQALMSRFDLQHDMEQKAVKFAVDVAIVVASAGVGSLAAASFRGAALAAGWGRASIFIAGTAINGATFYATEQLLKSALTEDEGVGTKTIGDHASDMAMTILMFGFLHGAMGAYGVASGAVRSAFRNAVTRRAGEALGRTLTAAEAEAAFTSALGHSSRFVRLLARGGGVGNVLAGFAVENVAFTLWNGIAMRVQAGRGEYSPGLMQGIRDHAELTEDAITEQILFLCLLRLGNAAAAPLVRPMVGKAEGWALGPRAAEYRALNETSEALKKEMEDYFFGVMADPASADRARADVLLARYEANAQQRAAFVRGLPGHLVSPEAAAQAEEVATEAAEMRAIQDDAAGMRFHRLSDSVLVVNARGLDALRRSGHAISDEGNGVFSWITYQGKKAYLVLELAPPKPSFAARLAARLAARRAGNAAPQASREKTPAPSSAEPPPPAVESTTLTEGLARFNEDLAAFDRASAAKRRGAELPPSDQAILDDPALKAKDAERAAFVKARYLEHTLSSADAPGSPTRAHLEAHLGAIDLGSHFELGDGAVFRDSSQVIQFSETLLTKTYRGELAPGSDQMMTLDVGGKPVQARVHVYATGESIDGVSVGSSGTGGRVVIGITFDAPIGREGIIELADGQAGLPVTRTTGGRQDSTQVVDGKKPPTNTMFIVGGPYGPTGTFGIFTVFSGTYAPPMTDAAYWARHAFLSGEAAPAYRTNPDGSVSLREGSALHQMVQEGKFGIQAPHITSVPSLDAPAAATALARPTPAPFAVDISPPAYQGSFGSAVALAPDVVADLKARIPRADGQPLFEKAADNLHITILGPGDVNELVARRVAEQPGLSKNAARKQIEAELKSLPPPEDRPVVTGVGSATDAAAGHTVFFATVEWPAVQALRARLDLPPKDLHITLASTAEAKPGSGIPQDVHGVPKKSNVAAFAAEPSATVKAQAKLEPVVDKSAPAVPRPAPPPLSMEGEFGTRAARVIGELFRSGLEFLHRRLGNGSTTDVDVVQAALDVFSGESGAVPADTAQRVADALRRAAGSNPSVKAQLAMRLMASPDAEAVVRELATMRDPEGRSALEELFPELAGKQIAQDRIYHHGETVFDHSVASTQVMGELVAANPQLARHAHLMRLVALFHDVGKHDDPDGPDLGRRQADDATGKVRFLGHAEHGAKLFEEMVRTRLNPNLPPGERLTEQEIALGRHLIERHMDGIQLTADGTKITEKAGQRYLARLCFENQELLRMGVPVEEILEASLAINEMDIRAAQVHDGKEAKLDRFHEVARSLRAALPAIKDKLVRQSLTPLIDGDDVISLGIAKGPAMRPLLEKIQRLQMDGTVLGREQALGKLAELAAAQHGIAAPEGWLAARMAAPGNWGEGLKTSLGAERTLVDENGNPVATVRLYRTRARAQFIGGVNPEALAQVLRSGAYPAIEAAIDGGTISVADVQTALTAKSFGNLPALEAFVAQGGDVKAFGMGATAPTAPVVEIVRLSDGQRIVMEAGRQGAAEHEGEGAFHVGAQRLEQLARSFQKPGEILEDTLSRFLGYAIRVAATSTTEIPSNRDEKSSFLLGRINGGKQYVAVLVNKADPGAWRIVTTLFASSPKEMRQRIAKNLLTQLKVRPQDRTPLSDDAFANVLASVNAFLRAEGQAELTVDALYGLDGPDGRGRERIEAALAVKGYEGKAARARLAEIEAKSETLTDALAAVEALPAGQTQKKSAPASASLPLLAPDIIRLLQEKGFRDGKSYGPKLAEIRKRVEAGDLKTAEDIRAAIAAM